MFELTNYKGVVNLKALRIRRILCVMMALAVVATIIAPIGSFTAFASTQVEGEYKYIVSDDGAIITGYLGDGGDVVLPDTLGGYPVTGINDSAFWMNEDVTSIYAPDVTYIDYGAFEQCTNLKTAYFPSLTKIGAFAFNGCMSLEEI